MRKDKHMLCETCARLNLQRSDFERPPFEPEGRYCSVVLTDILENLLAKQSCCGLCRLFLHAIQKNEQDSPELVKQADPHTKWEVLWMQSSQEYDPYGTASEDMYGSALFPRLGVDGTHNTYSVQLVEEYDTDGFLKGRAIPDTISPQMLRGWLDRCGREHGPDCNSVALGMPPEPGALQDHFLVVDVEQKCLVKLPKEEKYIALSYVWGSSNYPRTLNSNFEAFKQPGAFKKYKLPRTIADSIEVVRALKQRYLWVDSLCIVQEHDMKQLMIDNMDAVYGHAHVCIIAASGDNADFGLSGWADTNGRSKAVLTELIHPNMRLGVLPFFDGELMSSPHAQRAWT